MQPVKINITAQLTPAEIFFVEKSAELLFQDTLDTYRLRINNPKTILKEIVDVLYQVEAKTIRDVYARMLFDEAIVLLKSEAELTFTSVQKNYLLDQLKKYSFPTVFYCANIILNENENYSQAVFEKIYQEIVLLNGKAFQPEDFGMLNRLIGLFYIELRAKGYSKKYLHRFVRSAFSNTHPAASFLEAYNIIGSLINRPTEKFMIYVGFKISKTKQQIKINSPELTAVAYHEIKSAAASINKSFINFVKTSDSLEYYKTEIECKDYLQAGYLIKQRLQRALDILFMGHSENTIELHKYCFVVGNNNPTRGSRQLLDYQLDGKFASDQDRYIEFLEKIDAIEQKPLEATSRAKLYSGLRYLRLGTIADELENKLLNYWIAIEYLFSSADTDEDKVKRLRNFFKKLHSVAYAKRLFEYTHRAIKNLGLEGLINNYNEQDPSFITEPQALTDLITNSANNPLIAFRVYTLVTRFKNIESCKKEIERHQNNIEQNLMRVYRLRNEIVHSAASEKGIQEIAAHLRYYLTFIINGFIDFALNNPIDVNKDNKISLDDYFNVRSVQLDSLLLDGTLSINKLLKFNNPVQYLS